MVDAEISESGVCEMKVSEALVNKVTIRTLDKTTGEPCKGKTRPEVRGDPHNPSLHRSIRGWILTELLLLFRRR